MTSLSLQVFNYNGQPIARRDDGYLNASEMCLANGKLFADWNRLKSAKAYIKSLSEAMGIPIAELIRVQNGNQTWVHPSIAINLARWISPKFAVWCDAHIFNLMASGSTSLEIDPIEEMRLKIELARLENNKTQAELQILQMRQYIVNACPEPVQQKILGYQTVEKVEYRDRILVGGDLINDGSTMTKTELCKRYGFITKSGSPDFKKLNKHLESLPIPEDAWRVQPSVRDNKELTRDYLPTLDRMIMEDSRQLWFGE